MNGNVRTVKMLLISLLALSALGIGIVVHDRQGPPAGKSYVALVSYSSAGISLGP